MYISALTWHSHQLGGIATTLLQTIILQGTVQTYEKYITNYPSVSHTKLRSKVCLLWLPEYSTEGKKGLGTHGQSARLHRFTEVHNFSSSSFVDITQGLLLSLPAKYTIMSVLEDHWQSCLCSMDISCI